MQRQILRWAPLSLIGITLTLTIAANAYAENNRDLNPPSATGVPSVAPEGEAATHNTRIFLQSATNGTAPKVITGSPQDLGTGNCFPFGCAYSGEYQQVYTSSLFKEPIKIVGLQFVNTQFNSGATMMNSGTWTISLSTTSADWNMITTDFAGNIGSDNTQVFTGNLSQPWTFGYALNIPFSKPFLYNPSAGNLLMDVQVSGSSDTDGRIYFDTNGYDGGCYDGNTIFGRVYCDHGNNCVQGNILANHGYGLGTAFVLRTK